MVFKKNREKLTRMKKRAKKRGLSFDLDIKWLDEKFGTTVCEATGVDFIINDDVTINPNHPSIDRIDITKGYTPENCRVVIWGFNRARRHYTDKDVYNMCKALLK